MVSSAEIVSTRTVQRYEVTTQGILINASKFKQLEDIGTVPFLRKIRRNQRQMMGESKKVLTVGSRGSHCKQCTGYKAIDIKMIQHGYSWA